ncbi:hypothetical protein Dsin_023532 [Dipteronia sinensis]|uniref:Oxidoreductase N-terminal domain-containing protein n=1 Tax=Dipteronia sinensis TaxID=43782 RepID=A0AAE0A4D7_9ROSI|nr:hypothetical protein Dsin_023532 [Dipteronia sinensis]
MAGNNGEAVMMRNKQVILKKYIDGSPKESDLYLNTDSISMKVEQGTSAVIIKNLYFACDLYSMNRMKDHNDHEGYSSDLPGSAVKGFGVGKVVESGHAELKKGDLVWGLTGWEEYSLITNPESLIKILHTDLPLSYYTGILGISIKFVVLSKENMSSFHRQSVQLVRLLGNLQSCSVAMLLEVLEAMKRLNY